MRRTAAKFLPRLLNDNKEQKLFSVYDDLQDQASKYINILSKFITADYTWIYGSGEDSSKSHKFMLNRKWCWTKRQFQELLPAVGETLGPRCVNCRWDYFEGDTIDLQLS
jgi:hypothetical protein